jgi:hypothetical protein
MVMILLYLFVPTVYVIKYYVLLEIPFFLCYVQSLDNAVHLWSTGDSCTVNVGFRKRIMEYSVCYALYSQKALIDEWVQADPIAKFTHGYRLDNGCFSANNNSYI